MTAGANSNRRSTRPAKRAAARMASVPPRLDPIKARDIDDRPVAVGDQVTVRIAAGAEGDRQAVSRALVEIGGESQSFLATHLEKRIDGAVDDPQQCGSGLRRELLAGGAREYVVQPEHRADVERAIQIVALLKRSKLGHVGGEACLVDRARLVFPFPIEACADGDVSSADLASQRLSHVRFPS